MECPGQVLSCHPSRSRPLASTAEALPLGTSWALPVKWLRSGEAALPRPSSSRLGAVCTPPAQPACYCPSQTRSPGPAPHQRKSSHHRQGSGHPMRLPLLGGFPVRGGPELTDKGQSLRASFLISGDGPGKLGPLPPDQSPLLFGCKWLPFY